MTAKFSQRPTANSQQPTAIFLSHEIRIGSQVLKRLSLLDSFGKGYQDEKLENFSFEWKQGINETEARQLFHKTKELFDRAGIKFSLCFGSLLGAVREKGLIKGDQDMDIFTSDEERLKESLPFLRENGLYVWRIFPRALYSFAINSSCYIDVYIFSELRGIKKFLWGKSCIALWDLETPRNLFTGWSEVEFFGEKVTCPANPERLLEFWYGSDWRIPQNKKGTYRVKSAQVYHAAILYFFILPYLYIGKAIKFLFNKEYRQKILKRKKETGSFFFLH